MSEELKTLIKQRLKELNLSARRASIAGGLHPDAIRNVLRGKSKSPRGDTFHGIARGLKLDVDRLMALAGSSALEAQDKAPGEAPNAISWSTLTAKDRQRTIQAPTIPVFATKETQEGGLLTMGQMIEQTAPSEPVQGVEGAYAIYAPNDLLAPRCEQGDLLHVHPYRPARPGKLVLVHFTDESGDARAILREFASGGSETVTLRTLNPAREETLARARITAIHLVVGVITP